jgi:hypothetical protein
MTVTQITTPGRPYTIDDLREQPTLLLSAGDLKAMKLIATYDGLRAAIQSGRLPKPYCLGRVKLWEARAILRAIGAEPVIPSAPDAPPIATTVV